MQLGLGMSERDWPECKWI